jgi:YHS domain-containing protein
VIRVLLKILQFLFWLLLLRLVVRTVARAFSARPTGPRAAEGPSRGEVRAPEDLVLDRVCHTHVPRSRALVARVDGREEHFCSAECRDRARAAVARAS